MPKSRILCAIEACNKPIHRRVWCQSHYRFFCLYGDPLKRSDKFTPKTCSIDGCEEPAKNKGMCQKHFYALSYYGDPLYVRPTFERCQVEGCDREPYKRGYCNAHYIRLRRHGDPRGGMATFNGEPERYLREIILPFDQDACILWPFGHNAGYGSVYIDGQFHHVHRFVCEHAWGPPPEPDLYAAHRCGVRSCCSKQHLRWATPAENSFDRIGHGTVPSRLNPDQVREIRSLHKQGKLGHKRLADRFGVTKNAIKCILDRKTWAWLAD